MGKRKIFRNIYTPAFILFLYVPLFVMVLFSFNSAGVVNTFRHFGFGFQAYLDIFTNPVIQKPIILTLVIGFLTTIISTFIGTTAAICMSRLRGFSKKLCLTINNIPVINADVVTGAALLVLFLSLGINLGFFSVLFAHVAFCTPYVVISVLTSIRNVDQSLVEASLDLGASPTKTLRKVVLPLISKGILAGAAIAFATSFDDFLVTYFVGGNVQNVSTYLYTQKLKALTPWVNALSTMLMIIIAIFFITSYFIKEKKAYYRTLPTRMNQWEQQVKYFKEKQEMHVIDGSTTNISIKEKGQLLKVQKHIEKIEKKHTKGAKQLARYTKHKKSIRKGAIAVKIMAGILPLAGGITLIAVYIKWTANSINFGTFGSYFEDSMIAKFQRQTGVYVNQVTYDTNEELGVKLNTLKPDLFVASDYYQEHLYEDGINDKIDWSLIRKNLEDYGWKNDTTMSNDDWIKNWFYPGLYDSASHFAESMIPGDDLNMFDATVPYYSGNLGIVYNKSRINWNNVDNGKYNFSNTRFSWSAFLTLAQDSSKKLVIYNDARNFMLMGSTLISWNGQLGADQGDRPNWAPSGTAPNKYYDPACTTTSPSGSNSVAKNMNCLTKAYAAATDYLGTHKNIRVMNDDIVDTVASQNFDAAMIYNGDLMSAVNSNTDISNKIEYGLPMEGTNFWFDGISVAKNLSPEKKEKVYKFIAWFLQPSIQGTQAADTGYTPSGTLSNVGMVLGVNDKEGSLEDAYGVDGSALSNEAVKYLNPFWANQTSASIIDWNKRDQLTKGEAFSVVFYVDSSATAQMLWDRFVALDPTLTTTPDATWVAWTAKYGSQSGLTTDSDITYCNLAFYNKNQMLTFYYFLNSDMAKLYAKFLASL